MGESGDIRIWDNGKVLTWAEINRKRLPYIKLGEKLFKGMYNELKIQLLTEINEARDEQEMIQISRDIELERRKVQEAFERYYAKTSVDWAKMTAKSGKSRLETKQEDDWLLMVLEYVRTKKGKGIDSIIATHGGDIENIVRKAVEQGISEGIGMDKIARNISTAQGEMDTWKALRIARTEVVNATGEGVKIGASELPGNKTKTWISTFDQRSRHDHMAMDGVEVPMNEMFNLPSGSRMEYPGDSVNGMAKDVCNCRCGYEITVKKDSY